MGCSEGEHASKKSGDRNLNYCLSHETEMLSTDPTINEWKNESDYEEEMSKTCWITEPQSYLSFYSCVFLFLSRFSSFHSLK